MLARLRARAAGRLARQLLPLSFALYVAMTLALPAAPAPGADADYQAIKATVKVWLTTKENLGFNIIETAQQARDRKRGRPVRDADSTGEYQTLRDCGSFSSIAGIDGDGQPRATAMIDLAADVLYWSHRVESFGYPRAAWAKLVADFEQEALREIVADDFIAKQEKRQRQIEAGEDVEEVKQLSKALAEYLEAYRTKHRLKLPPLGWSNLCGASDEAKEVVFKTSPPNGAVSLIPAFFFEVCKSKTANAADLNQCRYWRNAVESKSKVLGEYYVQVRWDDGKAMPPKRYNLTFPEERKVVPLP